MPGRLAAALAVAAALAAPVPALGQVVTVPEETVPTTVPTTATTLDPVETTLPPVETTLPPAETTLPDGPVLEEDDVTTTSSNGLSLSVPTAASLTGALGGTLSAQLGLVTVQGGGSVVARAWTVTVTATDLVTDGGSIPAARLSYASGPAVGPTPPIAVPGQVDPALAQTLAVPVVAFTGTFGLQVASVSWNPTLVVSVPPDALAGAYTGTITHTAT